MIYRAADLNYYLNYLTLAGQDFEGNLQWIGDKRHWDSLDRAISDPDYDSEVDNLREQDERH